MSFKDVPDLPFSRGGENYRAPKPDKVRRPVVEIDVAGCTVEELLSFRQQINEALPARSLKDLDLSEELVIQVLALQLAQSKALESEDTPTNQIAQAMNALSAALTTLVKLQNETFTSERLKKAEAILVSTLQELPAEAQEQFLTAYAAALGTLS